jgi:hypothetical protein
MKATRKVSVKKRRAVFVESEVNRWNRPDPVSKRCADLLEQIRTYLAHVNETDLVGYARLLYLKHSTRSGIAAEYAAISSNLTLLNFIEKYEGVNDPPLDTESLEEMLKRADREGFWKGQQ